MAVAMDMAAMDTGVSMGDMEDTDTERGRLRLPLMSSLVMDTDMAVDMDMAVTDTARGALRLRPMPSPAMDTTAVDTDMAVMDTDVSMVDMVDTDTERGALMPRLSPDMATMAVAMEAMAVMVMDVSMVDTADTTDKFHLFLIPLQQHSFLF